MKNKLMAGMIAATIGGSVLGADPATNGKPAEYQTVVENGKEVFEDAKAAAQKFVDDFDPQIQALRMQYDLPKIVVDDPDTIVPYFAAALKEGIKPLTDLLDTYRNSAYQAEF